MAVVCVSTAADAEAMTHTHHAIDYIELAVVDLAAARSFYEAAFGWGFNDYGPEYAGIRSAAGDGEGRGVSNAIATPSPARSTRSLPLVAAIRGLLTALGPV